MFFFGKREIPLSGLDEAADGDTIIEYEEILK